MNGKILKEAMEIVNGERQKQYGKPENSFLLIAKLWNIYLQETGYEEIELGKRDVAFMMLLLKVARELNLPKHDNLVDLCGYAALYADMVEVDVVHFTSATTLHSCEKALRSLGIVPKLHTREAQVELLVTTKSQITDHMEVGQFIYADDYADYGELVQAVDKYFND